MSFSIRQLHPVLVGEVAGIDCSPAEELRRASRGCGARVSPREHIVGEATDLAYSRSRPSIPQSRRDRCQLPVCGFT